MMRRKRNRDWRSTFALALKRVPDDHRPQVIRPRNFDATTYDDTHKRIVTLGVEMEWSERCISLSVGFMAYAYVARIAHAIDPSLPGSLTTERYRKRQSLSRCNRVASNVRDRHARERADLSDAHDALDWG